MSTYLVTGAGRGIGLELSRQLAALGPSQVSKVFATTRGQPSEALKDIITASDGRVSHVPCEVTDSVSVGKAAELVKSELSGKGLDVLINNVGVQSFHPDGIFSMPDTDLQNHFNINVVSAHRVTAALLPLLRNSSTKKIVNISTTLGSIAQTPKYAMAPVPAYKITKAALNMLTAQYASELGKDGFTVLAISPGWLKTDMGSSHADLEVEVGIEAVLKLVISATPEMNGRYLNIHVPGWENASGPNQYDGKDVPW